MIAFICLFFPSILGLWLFESLSKQKLTVKQCVYRGCTYALVSNFICFAVKKIVLHTAAASVMVGGDMTPGIAFNYLVIVIPVVVVLVIFEILFSKKITISVEDVKNEEK